MKQFTEKEKETLANGKLVYALRVEKYPMFFEFSGIKYFAYDRPVYGMYQIVAIEATDKFQVIN
jgi:hypothetical protein